MKEREKIAGAVKCKLMGRNMEGWEQKLDMSAYKVELMCLAMYDNVYFVSEDLSTSPSLPIHEDIPGSVSHVCLDRTTLWFCPSTYQSALDTMMDQLNELATKLTPLHVSHLFSGQFCVAKFSGDGGLYRARVTRVGKEKMTVFYVDFGNNEDKDMDELFVMPEDFMTLTPAVAKVETENSVSSELEDKLVGVEVVLRMEEGIGKRLAKFFIEGKEMLCCPEQVRVKVEILPVGMKIEVSVGYVESVRMVWVTPMAKVDGIQASQELVEKVTEVLATQDKLATLASPQIGQMAVARFSEDDMLYRCRVEEEGFVRFIDFGNGEVKEEGMLYKMPVELEIYPVGAFKIELDIEETVVNTKENRMMVEEKLTDAENLSIELSQGRIGTCYKEDETMKLFKETVEETELGTISKGNIIEISVSDEEEIEVSDGEEAETQPSVSSQGPVGPVAVTVNVVETVSTVWVTRADSYSALDKLRDQLADLEGRLQPLTGVQVGDLVVARFSGDEELYRGKVTIITEDLASVVFFDYGDTEQQPVGGFMEMPRELRDMEPLAEKVRLLGGEYFEDSKEMWDQIDNELGKSNELGKEGLEMLLNDEGEATFCENGKKIKFCIASEASDGVTETGGWKVGDKVAYRTASTRWRRGVIQRVLMEKGHVLVKGEEDQEEMVDIRYIKSAEMPLEALNQVEEDLTKSVKDLGHKYEGSKEGYQGCQNPQVAGSVMEAQPTMSKPNITLSKPTKQPLLSKSNPSNQSTQNSPAPMFKMDKIPAQSKVSDCNSKKPIMSKVDPILVQPICSLSYTNESVSEVKLSLVQTSQSTLQNAITKPDTQSMQETPLDKTDNKAKIQSMKETPLTKPGAQSVQETPFKQVMALKNQPVFRPTASLPQQVVTDWIAGCVEMMDRRRKDKDSLAGRDEGQCGDTGATGLVKMDECPGKTAAVKEVPSLDPEFHPETHTLTTFSHQASDPGFLSYCQTPPGSEAVQHLLNNGDQETKERIFQSVMSCDLLDMVTNHQSCQVVQKLCSCVGHDMLEKLVIPVSKQFITLSLHPSGHQAVLAVLAVASQDQRNMITSQLESENTLLQLLKDKHGYFVVQRCLPYIQAETISCIAKSLECRVVEVGRHPQASAFLQEFFRQFNGKDRLVDILQEKVMDSLECLAYCDTGLWLVQTVIKLGQPTAITKAIGWLENNMQNVLEDCKAVFVARTLVQQLLERSMKGVENTWSQAMDRLVAKMIDTMVVVRENTLPLIIVAAMHQAGHIVVQEVARQKECLGNSRVKMKRVMEQHRIRLRVDTFGCLVVKGMEGWM
eukprot:GFUD01022588.1.p1 GENE.GFUD01022588.1~~GFUD01022588.1.p1  ORF type:complete len:1341 (+),score=457.64 GFUD01022588.1:113-4024(+)